MSAQDTGPLDWRIAITDAAGRPTPEFQRRWAIQRANNALIGAVMTGAGAPITIPEDGDEYIDVSVTPYVFYFGLNDTWHQVGVKFFLDLADVPHSYSGQGLKLVRVNSGATALEFVTPPTIPVGANPTGTGSDTATNGVATTFLRSDATFAIQKASASIFGLVKVDGTTITATSGVISSTGGGGGSSQTEYGVPPLRPDVNISAGANFGNAYPFVAPSAAIIGSLKVFCQSASATTKNIPVIYSNNGSNQPGTLLASGSVVTGVSAGVNKLDFTTPLTLVKGTLYWFGIVTGTAALPAASCSTNLPNCFFTASSGTPPNPVVSPTLQTSANIAMWISTDT